MFRFLSRGGPPVLAALLLAMLAACGSGGSGASSTASPTAMTNAQILAIGREAAQCMRDHGVPDFPDPVVDNDGHLQLPAGAAGDRAKQELAGNPAAQTACEPILNRLPANAVRGGGDGGYTAQDLENLKKFAQCVRQNGIPEFPDPRADGTFPLAGTPLEAEGKSERFRTATQACKQYWDKGIRGS
jgi:hypothetical protein